MENDKEKINWIASEFEHREKNPDWFWALGIVIVAGAIASIIYGNYSFAIVLVFGGTMMGYLGSKAPRQIEHELNSTGLKNGDHFFPYKSIQYFWVREGDRPMLFIKTNSLLFSMLSIPIENSNAKNIRKLLISKKIKEEETKEHMAEKILEFLGY